MCSSLYCAKPHGLPHEYLIAAHSCHVHLCYRAFVRAKDLELICCLKVTFKDSSGIL